MSPDELEGSENLVGLVFGSALRDPDNSVREAALVEAEKVTAHHDLLLYELEHPHYLEHFATDRSDEIIQKLVESVNHDNDHFEEPARNYEQTSGDRIKLMLQHSPRILS